MKNTFKKPVAIPVNKLHGFENHPFKVLDNEEMNTLIESIQHLGIITPLTVRPLENTEDEYEVISGHRRLHAAVKAGLDTVPAFIFAVSRDEAAIMLVDNNLHREHILPSEKAFAYKLKMAALSHQGASRQLGEKWSVEQIAESANESKRQVHRYIRLTNLIPELLDMMDEGKIAFSVGVELSFLDDELQYDVLNACEENDNTPSYAQAVEMRKLYKNGELDCDYVYEIMSREKANQRITVKIPQERLYGKIPNGYNAKQTEDFIVKAVEYYHRFLQRQRDSR
ncbi:MAG: ParB/RepB/Spo0J family partition protein [Clostridia bacterium]|nr:ParB/RepB/Spo0J family partition protein [Clostridia bacterium]